jgi:hypothetical protein
MYILDANVFILANRHDFPIDTNPGTFWDLVEKLGNQGELRVPETVFEELSRKEDIVKEWILKRKDVLMIPTEHSLPFLPRVLNAYGIFSENDLEIFDGKADPFLIAEGIASMAVVVSDEIRHPTETRIRYKKIPDICDIVGVSYLRYPRFLWELSA